MDDRSRRTILPLMPWLPDETLFSLVSRHHRLWGPRTSSWTALQLFGGARIGVQHDFPSGLRIFELTTAGELGTATQIAVSHTLLVFYLPFTAPELTTRASYRMQGQSVNHLKFQLGIARSGLVGLATQCGFWP